MTSFDSREKAFENKYFRDKDLEFKIISRRRKLLGLWAAHRLHLGEEESLEYALDIVKQGVDINVDGGLVSKILDDFNKAGLDITEADIRREMAKLHNEAEEQIKSEYKA